MNTIVQSARLSAGFCTHLPAKSCGKVMGQIERERESACSTAIAEISIYFVLESRLY